jgi:flagellin-like hook-associated protein FlgL
MPFHRTGENPVCRRTINQFKEHTMPGLPTNTSAMTALAASTPAGQNLTQVANQVPAGLANSIAADNPAYWPVAPKMSSGAGLNKIETNIAVRQQALPSIGGSMNIPAAAAGGLANTLTDVETAIGSIATAASRFGAPTVNLTMQRTFFSNPSDSLTTGVDSLVAANMNEATTKLAALQVSQQLGVQALSISHSKARLILKLFEL